MKVELKMLGIAAAGIIVGGLLFIFAATDTFAYSGLVEISAAQLAKEVMWIEPDEGEIALEASFLSPCDYPPFCTKTAESEDLSTLRLYGFVDYEDTLDLLLKEE
jgi:hypothetical protein